MPPSVVMAAAGAEAANPISFDFWTFLFQALNVLIVMGLLYKMLFKPLSGIMRKREIFVEESLTEARDAKSEAEKLLAEYREQRAQVRQEAQQIISKAAKDAEEYAKSRRREADAQAERTLEKAKGDIENARKQALAEIRDEVASIAILAAEKVVGRAIDDADQRAMVEDFVDKVGEVQ